MRTQVAGDRLFVRAVSGTNVVTLGWDLVNSDDADADDLMGFAVARSIVDSQGVRNDTHWLTGIKRFKGVDDGLEDGAPVSTARHPVQSFQWADYAVKKGTRYEYVVAPVRGTPGACAPVEAESVSVEIETEVPVAEPGDGMRHDVYFNRGVAGSQAYARLFPDVVPDENQPQSDIMKWLSRGLFEALTQFIGRAAGDDAQDYALRAMLYEFRYPPSGQAFKAAADAAADVDIRYEAQSYLKPNEKMISDVGIGAICTRQAVRPGIRHNKFIVLLHKGDPVAVWTGSTNISAGGIFGHSNVGHVIHDPAIAQRYLDYWERLAEADVDAGALKRANAQLEPTPAAPDDVPGDRVMTLFSPRDRKDSNPSVTLAWYADLLASAKELACITFAFNFDPTFQRAIQGETDALTYMVLDKPIERQREAGVRRNRNTIIAVGGMLVEGDIEHFLGERLTGFNTNRYIHDKFLLVDPLSDDPIVVTGTANFSEASQETNDENMVVIRGDTRVAGIYFGEFMRIFNHHYTRYVIARIKAGGDDPDDGFLKSRTRDWAPAHFRGYKAKRRQVFAGTA